MPIPIPIPIPSKKAAKIVVDLKKNGVTPYFFSGFFGKKREKRRKERREKSYWM